MSLSEVEYAALRNTIATRGTVRIVLFPFVLLAWATLAAAVLVFTQLPIAAVFPLAVLVAGFEGIHALHVGVERIGRYLQVFYEARGEGAQWETTAMAVGPTLPGGGVDPLFTIVFIAATMANLVVSMVAQPTWIELGVVTTLHILFALRLVRARGAAARQRAVELETFRAIKATATGGRSASDL